MDYMLELAGAALDRLWPVASGSPWTTAARPTDAAPERDDPRLRLEREDTLRQRVSAEVTQVAADGETPAGSHEDWRWKPRSVQSEILADVFYQKPTLAADVAAQLNVVPAFIARLAQEISQALADRQGWQAWAARKTRSTSESGATAVRPSLLAAFEAIPAIAPLLKSAGPCGLQSTVLAKLESALIANPSAVLAATRRADYAVPFSMVLAHEIADIIASRPQRDGHDLDAEIAMKASCLERIEGRLARMAAFAAPLGGLPCQPSTGTPPPPPETPRWFEAQAEDHEKTELGKLAVGLREDLTRLTRLREGGAAARAAASASPVPAAAGAGDASARFAPRLASDHKLVGLALSGGGIRSATFSLGALQALADLDLLRSVDYLSTVSGGGYIGSWLLGWTCRAGGIRRVQRLLSPTLQPDPEADDVRPLRHLRDYGNYLAPQAGFFTADTWTLGAIWLRNTLLNLTILTLFLATALLAPRLIVLSPVLFGQPAGPIGHWYVVAGAISVLLFVCWQTGRYMSAFDRPAGAATTPCAEPPPDPDPSTGDLLNVAEQHVQLHVVIPTFCAALLLSGELYLLIASPAGSLLDLREGVWRGWIAGAFAAVTLIAGLLMLQFRGHYAACFSSRGSATVAIVGSAVGAGLAGGLLVVGVCNIFAAWNDPSATVARIIALHRPIVSATWAPAISWVPPSTGWMIPPATPAVWHAVALGPPLLVGVLGLTIILHIGLLGRSFTDERREWWSRLGAWLLIYCVGWTAVFGIAVYAPYLLAGAGMWLTAGALTWIATTAAGLYAARRPAIDAPAGNARPARPVWQDRLAALAPFVFVIGLLILISVALHLVLIRLQFGAPEWSGITFSRLHLQHWEYLCGRTGGGVPFLVAALTALGCALLAWRVDINEFSMHHMYKNRLLRCYLAASRTRRPAASQFTGFDIQDDVKLHALRSSASRGQYIGPFPIVNATVNFVKTGDLAWLERRGESFAFTPLYCGFAYARSRTPGEAPASPRLADETWRPTSAYGYPEDGGIGLGTAAAISGAAANPNMGYHSSPAAAFLLTVFNARLGWWMGNPRDEKSHRLASPTFGLRYLLAELFGTSTDRTPFVNLSDGGHFDNLGLYELVRRRCRTIIVVDGEQDGGLTSSGLGMAVRKCRIDFGAHIDIGLTPIEEVTTRQSRAHVVVGDITYADGTRGMLIYIKSSLTGDEAADVREYSLREPAFPHQPTADQFFSESQFESYRALGHHITFGTFKYPAALPGCGTFACDSENCTVRGCQRLDGVFRYVRALWFPPLTAAGGGAAAGALTYDALMTRIAENEKLAPLDPELTHGVRLPWTPEGDRSHFYTYSSVISFMHQVFTDARLEVFDEHPHNEGWMTIFRQWAHSSGLRDTWRLVGPSYDERFRRFCETRLDLR